MKKKILSVKLRRVDSCVEFSVLHQDDVCKKRKIFLNKEMSIKSENCPQITSTCMFIRGRDSHLDYDVKRNFYANNQQSLDFANMALSNLTKIESEKNSKLLVNFDFIQEGEIIYCKLDNPLGIDINFNNIYYSESFAIKIIISKRLITCFSNLENAFVLEINPLVKDFSFSVNPELLSEFYGVMGLFKNDLYSIIGMVDAKTLNITEVEETWIDDYAVLDYFVNEEDLIKLDDSEDKENILSTVLEDRSSEDYEALF